MKSSIYWARKLLEGKIIEDLLKEQNLAKGIRNRSIICYLLVKINVKKLIWQLNLKILMPFALDFDRSENKYLKNILINPYIKIIVGYYPAGK